MSDRISFVDLLIFSAPKGESPYAYAANYVAHIILDKPDWYYKQIIASGVLSACNLILTLTSLVVVKRRRQASGDLGSLWFFRTRYGHPSHIPYIMPNPLTMFLVWNAMFALLMQPYTWLNYFAYKYPSRAVTSQMYFWYGFIFTFDGAGMWLSAFGTLYATLLPRVLLGQDQKIPLLLHPVLLNCLCFSLPVLLYVVQITTSSLSQIAWSKLINLQFDLVENLTELSGEWLASNGTVNPTLRQVVSVDGNMFMSAAADSKAAFVRGAWAMSAWYFLGTVLLTPTAIWLLLALRRATPQPSRSSHTPAVRSPISTGGNEVSLSQQQLTVPGYPRADSPAGQNHGTKSQRRRLHTAFVTVALQFVITLLCLLTAVGSFAWIAIDIDNVVSNPVLQAIAILLSDWVSATAGVAVNILIIIRMTSQVESNSSHPSPENSQGQHSRAPSPSMSVLTRGKKPIPLLIVPRNTYLSEVELENGPKTPLSSDGHYTLERNPYD